MLTSIVNVANENDVILVMSNGGFNGIHGKLLDMLKNK
jgi:UDP-N-acetylmuramate-alanine ligase